MYQDYRLIKLNGASISVSISVLTVKVLTYLLSRSSTTSRGSSGSSWLMSHSERSSGWPIISALKEKIIDRLINTEKNPKMLVAALIASKQVLQQHKQQTATLHAAGKSSKKNLYTLILV